MKLQMLPIYTVDVLTCRGWGLGGLHRTQLSLLMQHCTSLRYIIKVEEAYQMAFSALHIGCVGPRALSRCVKGTE